MPEHKGQVNKNHEVQLRSTIEGVQWLRQRVASDFFERRAVYECFEPDLMWRDLTSNERVHMATSGWTQTSWDDRSRTPFREFPDAVYSDPTQANSSLEKFLSLSPAQKRAAARLGIQRHDWSECKLAAQPE